MTLFKKFWSAMFITSFLVCLSACNPMEIVKVPAKMHLDNANELGLAQLDFPSKTGTKSFTFTSESDWKVYVPKDCDWLTVNPTEGSAGSDISVSVTVKANEKFEGRTALLSFICGKEEQKAQLKVAQEMKYLLEVTAERTLVNSAGGVLSFAVNSNATWSYSIKESTGNWLTETELTSTRLSLVAGALTTEANTAVVSFVCDKDPDVTQDILVSQKDLELIFLKKTAYIGKGGVAEASIPVKIANVTSFNVDSDASWVTVLGKTNSEIKIKVDPIASASRTARLTLTTPDDASVSTSFEIKQMAPVVPDMLDVKFSESGEATDASVSSRAITYVPGANCAMQYMEQYKMWVPNFKHTSGANGSSGFYWLEIDDRLKTAMNDGYTLEAIVVPGAAPNGKEIKAFSSTKSGGTALMIASSSYGNELIFLINNGSWRFVRSGIVPEPGKIYHLVGSWDQAAGKARVYINGELKKEMDVTGNIKYGSLNPNYFMIGANQNDQARTAVNGCWNGVVATAKIYSDPVTPENVLVQYMDQFGIGIQLQ